MNQAYVLTDPHLNAGKMLQDMVQSAKNIEPIIHEDGVEYLSMSQVSNVVSMCQDHWLKDHAQLIKQTRAEAQAAHQQALANQLQPVISAQLQKLTHIQNEMS